MVNGTATLVVPLEILIETVKGLSIEDKLRLWDVLDELIGEYQDQHPQTRAEIAQALADFASGNYITIEDYIAKQREDED